MLRSLIAAGIRRALCAVTGHTWSREFGDIEPMPRHIRCVHCPKRVDLSSLQITEGPSSVERALRDRLARLSSVLDVRTSELAAANARIAALEHPTARTEQHG